MHASILNLDILVPRPCCWSFVHRVCAPEVAINFGAAFEVFVESCNTMRTYRHVSKMPPSFFWLNRRYFNIYYSCMIFLTKIYNFAYSEMNIRMMVIHAKLVGTQTKKYRLDSEFLPRF